MCTVTFLPLTDGGYLLGTNRDESPRRGPARPPSVRRLGERAFLAPIDADAGGTWVALGDDGRSLCILNGDRPSVAPPPAEPPSRGRLVLELLEDMRPQSVVEELHRRRIDGRLACRGFKLLVAEPGEDAPARLLRIDWDGRDLDVREEHGPSVVVSSTFEPDAVADARRRAFATLRERAGSVGRDAAGELAAVMRAWHAQHREEAPEGDAYSVCMHRPDARTVSFTQLAVTRRERAMSYRAGHPCEGGPCSESRLSPTPPGRDRAPSAPSGRIS